MAAFEFGKFISLVGRAISSMFGGGDQAAPISAAVATMPEPTKKKIYKDAKNKTFIGLANPTLNPPRMGMSATDYANSTITFDTTSYIDRALVSVENTGSASITINGFSIRGQQVVRLSGLNGLKWEYLNRRDIDINGEKEFKISSNFITNGAQCADVGDYVRKELEPHDMYSLTLHGIHPYFEVGDRYELVLDYKLPTMQFPTEQIAVDVEIRGVSIHRAVGSIGETMLSVRVPSGEWNNTTPTKARWIASGRMDQEQNRSNVLTIGAYDYAGTADIYCDGVDDDVEIQAAIDQFTLEGGGIIQLSRGTFRCNIIYVKRNITISGEGRGTIIKQKTDTTGRLFEISISSGESCIISNLTIDGDASEITVNGFSGLIYGGDSYSDRNCEIINVHIKNFAISTSAIIFYGIKKIIGCSIYDISSDHIINAYYKIDVASNNSISNISTYYSGPSSGIIGYNIIKICNANEASYLSSTLSLTEAFYGCVNVSSCKSSLNSSTVYIGFSVCNNIVACESSSNTGTTTGFSWCKSVQQCHSDDDTKYSSSYADAGTSNACADTPNGGFNS
ncbi:MAG: hypothetical protein WCX48_11605 [Bacteroidales bacterium]